MKILILSATIGSGHNKVAYTLQKKFLKENYETEVIKIFDNHKTINFCLNKLAPFLMPKLYKLSNKVYKKALKKGKNIFYSYVKKIKKQLLKKINSFAPDIIISTHISGKIFLDTYKEFIKKKFQSFFVVTDYEIVPSAEPKNKNDFVVVPEESFVKKYHLLGYSLNKILPFGIPIEDIYFKKENTEKLKQELLPCSQNKKVILFTCGGNGNGFEFKAIKHFLNDENFLIIICGKNVKLKQKIEKFLYGKKTEILILGFTENLDKFIAISDIVIGKTGGLTSTECVSKKTPLFSSKKQPFPELSNYNFLKEKHLVFDIDSLKNNNFNIEYNNNFIVKNSANLLLNFIKNGIFN